MTSACRYDVFFTLSRSATELVVDYVYELSRGRSRIEAVFSGRNPGRLAGLSATILSSIVRAKTTPTVPQIGRSLGYPRQTVQRHVYLIIKEGLVSTIANPDHRTAKRLVTTAAGQALHDRTDADSMTWSRAFASGLDEADLRITVATMRAIRHKLEDESGRPIGEIAHK